MKTNVKYEIHKVTRHATLQVDVSEKVAGPFEGSYQDIRQKGIKLTQVMNPSAETPIQFQLLTKNVTFYDPTLLADNYTSLVDIYGKDGYLIIITHFRHPKLKMWVENSTSVKKSLTYIIGYKTQADSYGNYFNFLLKPKAGVK